MFRRGSQPTKSAADAERQALFEKLAQRPETVCPFLGLAADRSEFEPQATDEHRCYAFGEPEPVSGEQQRNVCLQRGYANCPRYLRGVLVIPTDELEALRRPQQRVPPPPPPTAAMASGGEAAGGRRRLAVIALVILLLVGGGAGAWYFLAGPGAVAQNPTPTPSAPGTGVPSAAPSRQDSSASPISSISGTGSLGSVGSAASIEGTLRLTPAEQNRAGAAWYQEPVVVANGFTADFTFLLGGFVGDGGDGLALVVQTAGPDALGGLGAHLGYGGLANSLAVEFDTHFNAWPGLDDPNDNHVAVQTRGTEPNTGDHIASLVLDGDILDLSDGTPHRIVVTYRPGGLAVIIDGGDPLQAVLDITTTLELLEGGRAYIGFTASTGDTGQFTDLLALEITFP